MTDDKKALNNRAAELMMALEATLYQLHEDSPATQGFIAATFDHIRDEYVDAPYEDEDDEQE